MAPLLEWLSLGPQVWSVDCSSPARGSRFAKDNMAHSESLPNQKLLIHHCAFGRGSPWHRFSGRVLPVPPSTDWSEMPRQCAPWENQTQGPSVRHTYYGAF